MHQRCLCRDSKSIWTGYVDKEDCEGEEKVVWRQDVENSRKGTNTSVPKASQWDPVTQWPCEGEELCMARPVEREGENPHEGSILSVKLLITSYLQPDRVAGLLPPDSWALPSSPFSARPIVSAPDPKERIHITFLWSAHLIFCEQRETFSPLPWTYSIIFVHFVIKKWKIVLKQKCLHIIFLTLSSSLLVTF